VKYCSENNKRLIHFSTCEVYGKTIGSFLPKDHPLRDVMPFCTFRFPHVIVFLSISSMNVLRNMLKLTFSFVLIATL